MERRRSGPQDRPRSRLAEERRRKLGLAPFALVVGVGLWLLYKKVSVGRVAPSDLVWETLLISGSTLWAAFRVLTRPAELCVAVTAADDLDRALAANGYQAAAPGTGAAATVYRRGGWLGGWARPIRVHHTSDGLNIVGPRWSVRRLIRRLPGSRLMR